METVKISVNLSENTQNFIKSLFVSNAPVSQIAVDNFDPSQEDFAQANKKPAAPAASSASKSIEDVRGMLAKKVNEHRDVIKQKLNELGAPSVTKLDPAKYDEMYNFLESL